MFKIIDKYRLTEKKYFRVLLSVLGTISVGIGILGIFLPLLPTTVFLLFAAACYLRSSERLYNRLMSHKILGTYIRNYRDHRAMPVSAKVVTITFLWVTILISAFFATEMIWLRVLLFLIAAGVTIHLVMLKSVPNEKTQSNCS
ncbi:MAG: YbaN family protein [Candidatus Kapaibacterium sp.]